VILSKGKNKKVEEKNMIKKTHKHIILKGLC